MMGILGSITLMYTSFNYVQQTENEIVVVNLAREGIELVRAMRNNRDFDLFDPANSYDGQYIIDIDTPDLGAAEIITSTLADCLTKCKLYLNDGRYVHSDVGPNVSETGIKRLVRIKKGVSDDEKIITCEVSWTVKGKTHNYSLTTHLTNWQDT